jgi:hypothetical protein
MMKVTRILHITSTPPDDDAGPNDQNIFHLFLIRIKIALLIRRDFVLSISYSAAELTEETVMSALTNIPSAELNEALKNVIKGRNPILYATGFESRVNGQPCEVGFREPDKLTYDLARSAGW